MKMITYAELQQLDQNTYILLDTREDYRIAFGMIPGAIHISEKELYDNLKKYAKEFPAEKILLIYCQRGIRSTDLALAFEELGRECLCLDGGYISYLREKLINENSDLLAELGEEPEISYDYSEKKALIAMSGGVDSSLAAQMMKSAGYECIGCTMKLYDNDNISVNRGHTCCSLDDVEDARNVAARIGIPYRVLNFMDDFQEKVISRFVQAYESGITPNPCIDCNRYMKFDILFERGKEFGCEYIVTGHYARIEKDEKGKFLLKKAIDETKDQSYVLYSMTQHQLAHTLFPLGEMRKSDVRAIADKYGFINAAKPDSQDICFVPDGDYASFLEKHTGKKYSCGNFLDEEGNLLGCHKGTIRYTIGQRKGLGIALGKPMYVKNIDVENNTVTLSEEEGLYADNLTATEFNWISGEAPSSEIRCTAKIRYRHGEQPATAYPLPNGKVKVIFDKPQRAITPGQAVVLYDDDIVLGGGRITKKETI